MTTNILRLRAAIQDLLARPNAETEDAVLGLAQEIGRSPVAPGNADLLGGLFEQLIPDQERRTLGQYFTGPNVVDLILRFCRAHQPAASVLDPSCGAGVFLTRAYQLKRLAQPSLTHPEALAALWGCEVSRVPARLAALSLAALDPGASPNRPHILQRDFFDLLPGSPDFAAAGHDGYFDAIVGNPPYTRQEEMAAMAADDSVYKKQLIHKALTDVDGQTPLADLSQRAGIYAYFFVHGCKFLRQGGRFGFIVSNSWLDVDYGKGLQEFFLKHFQILAILESKVERWFTDADINTCIVILEKATGEGLRRERDEHLVHFGQLRQPLRGLIPPDGDRQTARLSALDDLIRRILSQEDYDEDDALRVLPKRQGDLWSEGYDEDQGRYVGSKWGKYLRAPAVFFRVTEQAKGQLVPLRQAAQVRFGIKTGANDFFYLTAAEIQARGIEREFWQHPVGEEEIRRLKQTPFWDGMAGDLRQEAGGQAWLPNYVVKSPQECTSAMVDPAGLKHRVLLIHRPPEALAGRRILDYLAEGQAQGYDRRPTCAQRQRLYDNWQRARPAERPPEPTYWGWYDLGRPPIADLLWFKAFNDRVLAPWNAAGVLSSDRFYNIRLHNRDEAALWKVWAALNTTLAHLVVEIWGRVSLGEGALDNMRYEAAAMPIVAPEAIPPALTAPLRDSLLALAARPIRSVFQEAGAPEPQGVTLPGVLPDRRALDRLVMGDVLGLTEEEQLAVYRAVLDLARTRLQKAESVKGR